MDTEKPLEGELLPAKKLGAPTKYTPAISEKFLELRCQGKTIAQSMVRCNIRSWETYKRWQVDFPEFREAVQFGEVAAQAYWEEIGERGICGDIEKFAASVYIFKMCNQFKGHYQQNNNGSVNVMVNNLPNGTQLSELSTKELDDRAKELAKKLLEQKGTV